MYSSVSDKFEFFRQFQTLLLSEDDCQGWQTSSNIKHACLAYLGHVALNKVELYQQSFHGGNFRLEGLYFILPGHYFVCWQGEKNQFVITSLHEGFLREWPAPIIQHLIQQPGFSPILISSFLENEPFLASLPRFKLGEFNTWYLPRAWICMLDIVREACFKLPMNHFRTTVQTTIEAHAVVPPETYPTVRHRQIGAKTIFYNTDKCEICLRIPPNVVTYLVYEQRDWQIVDILYLPFTNTWMATVHRGDDILRLDLGNLEVKPS